MLHDVSSCVVPQGACIGIIGPNGCGKSSLLSIIAGKVNPGHGRVDKVKSYTIGHVPQVFPDASRKTPLSMIGPTSPHIWGGLASRRCCGIARVQL